VARALVDTFSFVEAYVADLDAIAGRDPDWNSYQAIADCGLRLWIDAGLSSAESAQPFADPQTKHFVARVVLGLESLRSCEALAEILAMVGQDRLVFSLDLKHGRPLTQIPQWQDMEPAQIAHEVFQLGIRSMIVLDLARVGVNEGTGTETLARRVRALQPAAELIGGGGVRGGEDLRALAAAGYEWALVASALHDGRIGSNGEWGMRNGE
jgi:phosphoribosylformimino-5-aminoimidazole carboxamide ribotide isomerase